MVSLYKIPTEDSIKTVTDMREDAVGLLNLVGKRKNDPTIIFHRNSPKAVILSVEEYNFLLSLLEDHFDEQEAMKLEKVKVKKNDLVPEDELLKDLGTELS